MARSSCVSDRWWPREIRSQQVMRTTPKLRRREMRTKKLNSIMLAFAVTLCALPAFAQSAAANQKDVKTDSKIAYHNGPLITGVPGVYLIWYGTWDDNADNMAAQFILTDFVSNLGGSP